MAEKWAWRDDKAKNNNRIFETVAQYLMKGNKINHLTPKIEDTSVQYIRPALKVYQKRLNPVRLLI